MKNNVKYAGIAAAALLAVAPIATPIVTSTNNVQTAQAATIDSATQQSLNTLFGTILKTTTNFDTSATFPKFDDVIKDYDNKKLSVDDLLGLESVSKAKKSTLLDPDHDNLSKNLTFGVQGINASGSTQNANDFTVTSKDVAANGGTVSIQITAYDLNGNTVGSQILNFVNGNQVSEGVTGINVNYTNPYGVAVNSSTTAPQLTTSVDAKVQDQKGNDVKITNVQPANSFFTTGAAALSNDTSKQFTGSKFDQQDATYYQAVTLTLDPSANVKTIFDNMQNGKGGSIMLNGSPAIQANVGTDANANTIRFVREIKVGDTTTTPDNGTWKETTAPGVVTVNASIAHLYDDNNTLTSRSLASATGWQTDKYRTNSKTGIVQYHVSTHEWVNATDVSFKDSSVTGDGLGNVQNLDGNHIVSLAGPSGFVYTLYKLEGGTGNRGLAGDTAWLCNQTATDSQGRTYYRVSTNEWIREGTGVSFK